MSTAFYCAPNKPRSVLGVFVAAALLWLMARGLARNESGDMSTSGMA